MVDRITNERYDCPKDIRAVGILFDSLQCDIRACSGASNASANFKTSCPQCEHYVVNAKRKDYEELSKPIS